MLWVHTEFCICIFFLCLFSSILPIFLSLSLFLIYFLNLSFSLHLSFFASHIFITLSFSSFHSLFLYILPLYFFCLYHLYFYFLLSHSSLHILTSSYSLSLHSYFPLSHTPFFYHFHFCPLSFIPSLFSYLYLLSFHSYFPLSHLFLLLSTTLIFTFLVSLSKYFSSFLSLFFPFPFSQTLHFLFSYLLSLILYPTFYLFTASRDPIHHLFLSYSSSYIYLPFPYPYFFLSFYINFTIFSIFSFLFFSLLIMQPRQNMCHAPLSNPLA